MKTVVIREFGAAGSEAGYVLDLSEVAPRDCLGCWNCWLKTPGQCVHHDLDAFYRAYLAADKAEFYLRASLGLVSGNVKTLFDRMIPHYLPYIGYQTGESMHFPRYEHYPDVEIHYTGEFASAEERVLFEEYLRRVFYQFRSQSVTVDALPEAEVTRV